jgi:hypothetical protein
VGTHVAATKEAEMTDRLSAADNLRGEDLGDNDQGSLDPETRVDPAFDPETRIDPEFEPGPGDDAEVEPSTTDDPDLEAARAQAPSQDPMTLTTEELRPEEELTEYEPPYEPTPETASGVTAADERAGETLDERLQQEEPEAEAGQAEVDEDAAS